MVTVKFALLDDVARVADILAVVWAVTAVVVTVNLTEVFPLGIVTVAGTLAADELLPSDTVKPAAGAATETVTVPVDVFPPFTLVGLSVKPVIAGGWIVRLADWVVPFRLA